ncbi:MAG: monofunctional biosynthetic peptidoglycan transglycosylase [Nitrospirae bacterium]|nr:monofunctional biosynthetic peptidoglycan transglycosylase [Nitrospirota bacterium]
MLLIFILLSISGLVYYTFTFPNISKLKKENPKKTSFMEYRERASKKKGKSYKITQIWVPLSTVPSYFIKAALIAEDDKFWSHEGFDFEAIKKAIEKDIKKGKFAFGGSTITQQLARNLYLTPEKTLLRKIKEAIITWRIERVITKKRILELYLNVVEWGDGIFGIEAASRYYYNKPSSELTPEESARLAAVLPNPKRYSPTGESKYIEMRARLILDIMKMRGIILPEYEEITPLFIF